MLFAIPIIESLCYSVNLYCLTGSVRFLLVSQQEMDSLDAYFNKVGQKGRKKNFRSIL